MPWSDRREMGTVVSVDIVIVNWNSGERLRECLASIAAADRTGFRLDRVVVVDNDSSDGSAHELAGAGLPLTVRRNHENRGFAAACNRGAGKSRADHLLFLNPDTRLFADSLSAPILFMDSPAATDIGICGIQLVDDGGRITTSCARFPTLRAFLYRALGADKVLSSWFLGHRMREWNHRESQVVDQVMGAFFLVRRRVFESLWGFDERFFVYFEEVDLSLRAANAGWRSYFLASARAYHAGGGSSDQVKAKRLCYSLSSRIKYGYKHFSRRDACLLLLSAIFIEPISHIVWLCLKGSVRDAREVMAGYVMFYADLPKLVGNARRLTGALREKSQ